MRMRIKHISFAAVSLGALFVALPVLGQNSPESLLPPGFGDPAPAPSPAPVAAPTPAPGPVSARPAPSQSGDSSGRTVEDRPVAAIDPDLPSLTLDENGELDLDALDDALQPQYRLTAGERRSMLEIGVLTPEHNGLAVDAFGEEGGQYLTNLISNLNGPIISRWGSILLRRALLSKVTSPENINPADWTAERAWRLLLMGEADAARLLVLKVDGDNFTPRLYEVAMQAHLATADPAGICPFVDGGARVSEAPTWIMFRPICASLSGEQSRASSLLRQARRDKAATGIDYLLAEKTIGAGFEGRRAVSILWDDIEFFNNWRFGLGAATGVEPPDRLYAQAGRHVQGWRARAPMLSMDSRMKAADTAAAMGVFSSQAMVDLYSAAYDDPEASADRKALASTLRQAYTNDTAETRLAAMRDLWGRSRVALTRYSAKILTARAAAKIPPSAALGEQSADLIASMLTAGLDRSAMRWTDIVDEGSDGWALLAVASPSKNMRVSSGALSDFGGDDASKEQLRSKFLLAAIAGLGRADQQTIDDFASDLEVDLGRSTRWTRAIQSAAQRGQSGTVALLVAVGMQGRDWRAMSPLHLFHITQSLKRVGLEPEARMIAAEALSRT
ncbi:hypothetical protein HUO14_02430 [Parasphingorhabdus flavimaris]|uniref:Uncharacterized protein n=2 Tax=Parasphingorhabdus flavimaris TaxID=266812 RepID=A0ABX2MZ79_9SPHN|nr:hypothetical protein [Parasphingorhabdus flavimaris]